MINDPTVTKELVRSRFNYNPDTGWLTYKIRYCTKVIVGNRAGYQKPDAPYRYMLINRTRHAEHRVIWLHVYGTWPTGPIDHINRIGNDNRICNLRIVTPSQNSINTTRPTGRSGARGVWKMSSGRFRAYLSVSIGTFDTLEEAAQAAYEARKKHHGSEYLPGEFFGIQETTD